MWQTCTIKALMVDVQPRMRHLLVLNQQHKQPGRDRGQVKQILHRQNQAVVVFVTSRDSCKERRSRG